MNSITVGLDLLSFTIPEPSEIGELDRTLIHLFGYPSAAYHHHSTSHAMQQLYRYQADLRNELNDCLVSVFTGPVNGQGKLYRNDRILITVHGLAFSPILSQNSLELDQHKIFKFITENDGHVTSLDIAADDHSGALPIHKIFELSTPAAYKSCILSPLCKDTRGNVARPPLPVGYGSMYYGNRGRTQFYVYDKSLDPSHNIFHPDNPLKTPWVRMELKLRKEQCRKYGQQVVVRLAQGEPLAPMASHLFSYFMKFVDPTTGNLQPWYSAFLDQMGSLETPLVTVSSRKAILPNRELKLKTAEKQLRNILANFPELVENFLYGLLPVTEEMAAAAPAA